MTPPLEAGDLAWADERLGALTSAFNGVVVGQPDLRRALLVTLLAGGHVLVESVPGLAKTLAASTLARSVAGSFNRIQCTPDLLPSDIIGTEVFDPSTARFHTELGPVHANFILLDEINRSSAKTQSAMLEAMQEHQTTIGGTTHRLPDPFLVMATQNPVEEEGTYVLPQAQMDRFLVKETLTYPSAQAELEVLDRIDAGALERPITPVASLSDVMRLRALCDGVHVDAAIKRYIVELITVTRLPADHLTSDVARLVEYGASPRGTIAFLRVAKAQALLHGRDHVVPDDVMAMRHAVLRHRIVLTFEALAQRVQAETVIDAVFNAVQVP